MHYTTSMPTEDAPMWLRAVAAVTRALRAFTWRVQVTPALRERCIDYALRDSSRHEADIVWRADEIAEFIAKGRK